jgi:hypothetical protein
MAHDSMTGSDSYDPCSDFAAHLQRRLGISRLELGECLTQYKPARSYDIVFGSNERAQGDLASGCGLAAE